MRMKILGIAALAATVLASSVMARAPLRDVAVIDDGLFAVALADELRKSCDSLDARMFRALTTLNNLKRQAKAMGYSDAEIEDYVTSDAEKRRMRARGAAYLKANGVAVGDKSGYCALGKDEIKKNSAIGRLLRAK